MTKVNCEEDKRITYLTMTEKGRKLSQKYDEDFFKDLALDLDEIPSEDAECMIRTIEKFHDIMKKNQKNKK